jgi:hypothetical protein
VAGAAETVGGAGLYERLAGEGWGRLDERVRRLHARGPASRLRAGGVFAVRRGRGLAARALARLLGLPAGGEAVPLRLSIEPAGGGERWRRAFAGREFVTVQREHAGALLAERAGPFELLFRLSADGGALVYTQEGSALCAGPLKWRLPRLLAPRVEARERARGGGAGVLVTVRVTAPLAGLVIEYEGHVTDDEEENAG